MKRRHAITQSDAGTRIRELGDVFGLEDDEPRTLQGIGDRLHLSRERIRQIESRAKEKLRDALSPL